MSQNDELDWGDDADSESEADVELEHDGLAASRIYVSNRLMLLCHKHALALIDLADGNGVKLRIEPLEIEDWGQECRACMAADPEPDAPRIILPH